MTKQNDEFYFMKMQQKVENSDNICQNNSVLLKDNFIPIYLEI